MWVRLNTRGHASKVHNRGEEESASRVEWVETRVRGDWWKKAAKVKENSSKMIMRTGQTGLEVTISEGQLRWSSLEIKEEKQGWDGLDVCRGIEDALDKECLWWSCQKRWTKVHGCSEGGHKHCEPKYSNTQKLKKCLEILQPKEFSVVLL